MNGVFIHQQVKALVKLGHHCEVIQTYTWFPKLGLHKYHPYWQEGHCRYNELFKTYEGIKINRVPVFVKMPDRIFKEDSYKREAIAIQKYLIKHKLQFDVIYASFYTETAYVGTFLKRLIDRPLVSIARGDDIHAWPKENPLLLKQIEQVFLSSDVLLANSRGLARDAENLVGDSSKFTVGVVYNGIDTDKFHPISKSQKQELKEELGLPKDKKTLLCVATPIKLKGWLELLDTIANSGGCFSEWVLICVAVNRDFPDKLDLHEEAKTRGIEDKVIVIGQLNHEILVKFYQAVDAFVLPSYNEGLANVVLEAAATNLPMLITDVGGHKEVFENSNSTLICPPKNVNALTNSLRQFLSDIVNLPGDTRDTVIARVGSYHYNAKQLINHFERAIG